MNLHLKAAIWTTGRSQRRVAADVGIPETRLSEIVCGWRDATPDQQAKIAAALGQSIASLFGPDAGPKHG